MPTSQHLQISTIMDLVINLNPTSVLDVGVGFGKYGVLCREYLELWDGRENYHHFTRRIDGIEAFADYITPLHQYIYNHIYIGEAGKILKMLKTNYDLVLLIDVLEHLPKKDGRELVQALLKKHRGIIVSTPRDIGHQADVFGNVHEHHLAQWSPRDLNRLGPCLSMSDTVSHIVYLGRTTDIFAIRSRRFLATAKRYGSLVPGLKKTYHYLCRRSA